MPDDTNRYDDYLTLEPPPEMAELARSKAKGLQVRKRPVVVSAINVVVSAINFDGTNGDDVRVFMGSEPLGEVCDTLHIPTLEGVMRADPGDWIIKGVAGELYPCKADVFAQTYEFVEDSRKR